MNLRLLSHLVPPVLACLAWSCDTGKVSDHVPDPEVEADAEADAEEAPPKTGVECEPDWCKDWDHDLMWPRESLHQTHTWAEAVAYCEASTLSGFDDWRLPTSAELLTLVDGCDDPGQTACPEHLGPGEDGCYWTRHRWTGPCAGYWTSTRLTGDSADEAWYVNFLFGGAFHADAEGGQSHYVRCVR